MYTVTELCPTLCNPVDWVAHQSPLSMEFSRQEYWSGLAFPAPGIETASPALSGRFFNNEPPGKPVVVLLHFKDKETEV